MTRSVAELRRNRELYRRCGEHAQALEYALRVAKKYPDRESFFRLGYLYREVGKMREALSCFQRALLFRKGHRKLIAEIHLQTAYLWYQRRHFKRMREAIRRAYSCRHKPRFGHAFHHALGNYYSLKNLHRQALQEFERSLLMTPSPELKSVALNAVANCHVRLGNLDEARRYVEHTSRINIRHGLRAAQANNRTTLAAIHFDQGHVRLAMGILRRVAILYERLGKLRHAATAWMNAGYAASECGQPGEALRYLERSLTFLKPEDNFQTAVSAYACYATVLVEGGLYDRGKEALVTAARILRGHRSAFAKIFVLRAEARMARHFGEWSRMRSAARRAEAIARRVHDLVRVVEFQELRSEAESKLDHPRAALLALRSSVKLRAHLALPRDRAETLWQRAMKLASTSMPVLLVGEGGSGKTDLARMMHRWSPRSRRRCVVVPCEHLVHASAELNGHVAGAWSGAHRASQGWIRKAGEGTVILDRVDELDPEKQKILIPILDRRVRPVGSTDEFRVQARILATCRDPEALIPGVIQRLAGAVLRVPPLRDRRGEISDFVHHFLRNRRKISCEAMAELSRMDWEGNLAELEAATDRLVTLTDRWIGITDIRRCLGRKYDRSCTRPEATLNPAGRGG